MRRWWPLGLLFASAVALGAGGDVEKIFARFDHAEHTNALNRARIACVDCHGVGGLRKGATAEQLTAQWMMPPRNTCHECHAPGRGNLGLGQGFPASPHACGTCHDPLPRPETHIAGWLEHHGPDAQSGAAGCLDCHRRSACVDCHDRRENTRWKVHDASWLSVHGIAARADPTGCDSCHVKSECTTCHDAGAGFGRNP